MEYECILCGRIVEGGITEPEGWRMYHGVYVCDECSKDLSRKLDLLEFLRDLDSARSALKFASQYNVPEDVKERIESLISELNWLINHCRNENGIIDVERFDVVLIS